MALALGIGGTIAWLTDTTAEVKNTFTVGNIDIDLAESEDLNLKMVPGNTITKDPTVTVKAESEACWLFVKIEKSTNFDSFMTYGIADGWTELSPDSGIYWRLVDAATAKAGTSYTVLTDNKVTVLDTVTKDDMDALEAEDAKLPTLAFTAYAIQSANLADQNADDVVDAVDAWVLVSNQ